MSNHNYFTRQFYIDFLKDIEKQSGFLKQVENINNVQQIKQRVELTILHNDILSKKIKDAILFLENNK